MAKIVPGNSATAKTRVNSVELRKMFSEQLMRAVEKRGFVDELFKMLDQIEDPAQRLKCGLEMLKFVMPQLSAQRVEVVNEQTPVTQIVFQPAPQQQQSLIDVTKKAE